MVAAARQVLRVPHPFGGAEGLTEREPDGVAASIGSAAGSQSDERELLQYEVGRAAGPGQGADTTALPPPPPPPATVVSCVARLLISGAGVAHGTCIRTGCDGGGVGAARLARDRGR
jgi:hypothetical protein